MHTAKAVARVNEMLRISNDTPLHGPPSIMTKTNSYTNEKKKKKKRNTHDENERSEFRRIFIFYLFASGERCCTLRVHYGCIIHVCTRTRHTVPNRLWKTLINYCYRTGAVHLHDVRRGRDDFPASFRTFGYALHSLDDNIRVTTLIVLRDRYYILNRKPSPYNSTNPEKNFNVYMFGNNISHCLFRCHSPYG